MLQIILRALPAAFLMMSTVASAQTTTTTALLAQISTAPVNAIWSPKAQPIAVPTHLSQLIALQATETSRSENLARWNLKMQEMFTTEPLEKDEDSWSTAFWASTILPVTDLQREGVRRALRAYRSLPEEFQRNAMEAAYGVDKSTFFTEMMTIAEETSAPKHFAMATLYLHRASPDPSAARLQAFSRMTRRFPQWMEDPILHAMYNDILRGDEPGLAADTLTSPPETAGMQKSRRPSLRTIFSRKFAPNHPVIYTLQRKERSYPGMAIVRKPDGTFLRRPGGDIFSIAHLARARTNLPGYITNGNTPQGIFTIQGLGRTKSRAIGQTPYLHTFIPYELTPEQYFHTADAATTGTTWTLARYLDQLPSGETTETETALSWRDYLPMTFAYYAGKAGRGDMLAHGTTVDVEFYTGQSWYPHTPTSGCICAKEIWDPSTGRATMSDQMALLHAYLEVAGYAIPQNDPDAVLMVPSGPPGFLAVIELDGKTQPVTLDEVLTEILAAERM